VSIDLYLRCKKEPSIPEIEEVILPLGWAPMEYGEGRHEAVYRWFHREKFESLRGAWLYVSRSEEDGPKGTKTVFHAYSKAGRSYEDIQAKNDVVKALRKSFGGSPYNPQEGNCSYLINDWPLLTAGEKACGYVYITFQDNLYSVSCLATEFPEITEERSEWVRCSGIHEEGALINNVALPFLVSSLESFLREFFVAYLEWHPEVQETIYNKKNAKIEFSELKLLLSGDKTLAEIEADNYTFQNLNSANQAYKQYIDVDIFRILNKRKKVGDSRRIVREVILEMLELRHKIIHTAFIDYRLDKTRLDTYVGYTRKAGELFVSTFLTEKHFRIDIGEYV